MITNECPQCGAPLADGATQCKYCGEAISLRAQAQNTAPQQPVMPQQQYIPPQQVQPQVIIQQVAPTMPAMDPAISPYWPIKNKVVAGVLALFFGGLGVHKFYLGKAGTGILYLLFCWTFIPSIASFIEGIIYLCQSDREFQIKNQVRIG